MTATNSDSGANAAGHLEWSVRASLIETVARLSKAAVGGRRAARALGDWARRFGLSEAEFHVLWQLRSAASEGDDQTTLAAGLSFSPAQVSATVERLRVRSLIHQQLAPGDRRRHLWRLSADGCDLIEQMLEAAAHLTGPPFVQAEGAKPDAREAAA